jgi:hypothetical protein
MASATAIREALKLRVIDTIADAFVSDPNREVDQPRATSPRSNSRAHPWIADDCDSPPARSVWIRIPSNDLPPILRQPVHRKNSGCLHAVAL